MAPVDPIEFGRVLARLDAQDREIKDIKTSLHDTRQEATRKLDNMQVDINKLVSLADQGKGSLWMLITIGGFMSASIGWVVGWAVNHFFK